MEYKTKFILIIFSLAFVNIWGQTIKDVEILKFDAPFSTIIVNVDGEPFEYNLDEKTKFDGNKSGDVPKRYFKPGSFIDLTYDIVERKRNAKKIKLNSDYTPGKEKVKGILESFKGDIGFIDGRKVQLDGSTTIQCKGTKECGCTKGMVYLGYNEIKQGDYLEIQGNSESNGIVIANTIKLCENNFTLEDKKVLDNVESSLNKKGLRSIVAPSEFIKSSDSLSQGKLKMGIIEYKVNDNIQLQGYVNVVGLGLIPGYAKTKEYREKHNIDFRFFVIDNKLPNAYALPNGMIFIHTGLLKIIENEAQLAVVLGHEIAHVIYKHAAERLKTNSYLDSDLFKSGARKLFSQILSDNNDKSTNSLVIKSIEDGILATKPSDLSNLFHIDDENQADRVGLYYAFTAGYDIREAVNFWRNILNSTSDLSYSNMLQNDTKNILLNIKLDNGSNLNGLSEQITSSIVSNLLNTIYTSHPTAKLRLKEINDLLNSIYINENLDLNINKSGYQKRTSLL